MGDFISSILIWTPVRRNALIHCILSNCLFGGGEGRRGSAHFWTLAGFQAVVHITLPACSDFLLVHPRYLVKTFFSSSAGKTSCPFTPDYCVHLLRRSVFLRLAAKKKKGMKYLGPADISTRHYHLVPPLPLHQSGRSADGAPKRPLIFPLSHWLGLLLPFVQVARLNWIDWVIICQVILSWK